MPKVKAAPKKKAANGYKIAERLPVGEILQDIFKKEWKLGPSIGQGGFGLIYSAKENASKGTQYPYAIKIEPHANGPLFVEMHFLMKNAKQDDVESFKKTKGLKNFGMPLYLGSGSYEYNGEKYRFIVMEKFGHDLWSIFLENNKIFPTTAVFKVAVQVLDVLEYIHSRGYVHADIKAANILMGVTKETQNKQCYLVDFGLATKWSDNAEFKPNPKRAHDGTIEYLSRDAHLGVQTRRGDLEILAYNIIQWLGCDLPWEKKMTDPVVVQRSKEENMSSIPTFMKTCFGKKLPPGALLEFLKYLSSLKHNTKPDYQKIRKIFLSGIDSTDSLEKPFNFSLKNKTPSKRTPSRSPVKKASASKRKSSDTPNSTPKAKNAKPKTIDIQESSEDEKENLDDDYDDEDENLITSSKKKEARSRGRPKRVNNVEESDEEPEKVIVGSRSRPKKVNKAEDSDEEPEKVTVGSRGRAKKVNESEESDEEPEKSRKKTSKKPVADKKKVQAQGDNLNLNGYTAAMKEIFNKKMEKEKAKEKKKKVGPKVVNEMEGFTDSMKEIALKKKERLAKKGGN